jgi:hypothetical protein
VPGALRGGSIPQISSMSVALVTTRPALIASMVSSCRGLVAVGTTETPAIETSTGPSTLISALISQLFSAVRLPIDRKWLSCAVFILKCPFVQPQ